MYLTLLKKQFPDAEIVTPYLGSNHNEQLFAIIQVSNSSEPIIFGSDWSETNNEPTLRLHKKYDKKSRKKFEKLFFAQICLKQIMSQLSDNTTKKKTKIGRKIEKLLVTKYRTGIRIIILLF